MPHTNRLANETSPYLLQHQHNPVDWYPWGEEAFDRARREDKPIFLSVGYSTCYWCHVMERQCFEVESIAAQMNRLFVCIKVDREERPDVDQLYMTAIQIISRQGGWPMSIWLTPDLRPFFGGTYYPPTDMQGRPGFPRVCNAIDDAWRNRSGEIAESAGQITSMLERLARPSMPSETLRVEPQLIGSLIDRSVADYEPHFGGFGHVPKFPRQTVLELLLAYLHSDLDGVVVQASRLPEQPGRLHHNPPTTGARTPKPKVRQMTLHALDAMMHGGIRDHLGGGFHRYSTDAKWLVPHFEIMLYDNAMLLVCYAEAYRLTGDARYAQVSRDIADFVLREMTSPVGAFYTAFDAEVDHQEGLNYLWTAEEIEAVLGATTPGAVHPGRADDIARFLRVYGVDRGPNFADPHHGTGLPDKNILYIAEPNATPSPLLDADLAAMRLKLRHHRQTRKQPLLDTKVLTSWNALMIRGLAVAGRVLQEQRYVEAAARAADFLLTHHRTEDGGLFRTSRDGVKKYRAFLDDYAFLAWALTDLAVASQGPRWTAEAKALVATMTDRFGDADAGGFYFTDRAADDLFVRQKTAQDSPLPSGNAAAVLTQVALGDTDNARRTLAVFAQPMVEHGESMGSMVQAALITLERWGPFAINVEEVDAANGTTISQNADVVAAAAERVSPVEIRLHLSIRDGWHVNVGSAVDTGTEPTSPAVVPTTVATNPASSEVTVEYPRGTSYQPDPSIDPVEVYSGRVTIIVRFPRPAVRDVRLTLHYQPCNATACLPPVTQVIRID